MNECKCDNCNADHCEAEEKQMLSAATYEAQTTRIKELDDQVETLTYGYNVACSTIKQIRQLERINGSRHVLWQDIESILGGDNNG